MMDGSTETLTRRGLLRGQFTSRKKDAGPGWCAVEGIDTRPGDVFWCGWADEAGVLVAGDDGVILQFDGESWIRETAPVPVPVHALWGRHRGDLWAVGWMGMILHHDGEGWTRIRGCVVDEQGKYASIPENTPLFDIAGREDGHAWAVGDRGTILHYDGQGWSAETSGTRAHLRSVIALADGRVMASGGNGTVLIRSPQGEWTPLSCPVGSNFTASAQLEDGLVLLAGGRYFVDPGGFRGDLVLFDGESFVKLFEGMEFSRFRAVGTVREGIITLGDAGQVHLIRNKRIDRVASGTAHDLLGLVKVPGGEALVVGDFGVVLAGDSTALASFAPPVQRDAEAANWSRMDSGTDRQLWGLWHDREADRLYACGEEGTVLCLDRGKWERLPPVGELGIHDLGARAGWRIAGRGPAGRDPSFRRPWLDSAVRPAHGHHASVHLVGRGRISFRRGRRGAGADLERLGLGKDALGHEKRALRPLGRGCAAPSGRGRFRAGPALERPALGRVQRRDRAFPVRRLGQGAG